MVNSPSGLRLSLPQLRIGVFFIWRAVKTQLASGSTLNRVLRNVIMSQVTTEPKIINRNAQPATRKHTRMINSDQAAPT